ncbi:hypothetical protein [Azospirillum halopraeferens]|uniref:hypothetical protein n=1 Tax=Azospirillum halopraeferens TaxID=34010 RepID=UPI000411FDDD|nr:hypothetical protein [Azospirillum halopraeferens]
MRQSVAQRFARVLALVPALLITAAAPASADRGAVTAAVAAIERTPEAAAQELERYDDPAAKAWRVYLYHIGAAPVPGTEVIDRRSPETLAENRRLVAEILDGGLPDDRYLMEEIRNLGDIAGGSTATVLFFLRHVLSTTDLDVPCFLLTRHGQAAFEAFGAFWGGVRDSRPDVCTDAPALLFDRPEWRRIAGLIDPVIEPALAERGAIRIAYERQFRMDALQATLVPSTLLEAPHSLPAERAAARRRRAVEVFRSPGDDLAVLPQAVHTAVRNALPAAIDATAKVYRDVFKLAPKYATEAAEAAAERFIAGRIGLFVDG